MAAVLPGISGIGQVRVQYYRLTLTQAGICPKVNIKTALADGDVVD
jgi:hypothetical protein